VLKTALEERAASKGIALLQDSVVMGEPAVASVARQPMRSK
jgi:hypothetical protein